MNKLLSNYFQLTIWCTILFLAACGGKRSDDQIQQDVTQRLSSSQNNNQAYASVSTVVKDGVVTINGQCEGDNCSDSVIARIKDVEGVKDVVNNIQQTATPTDLTLRTSVQSIISKYQGVQADVAAGVVVLRGTIQRDQIQPLMNELSSLKAKKIDNQLAIQQL